MKKNYPKVDWLAIICCAILVMCSSHFAHAQMKITGTVKDLNNQGVADVTVTAQKSKETVSTNASGAYEIMVKDATDLLVFTHVSLETGKEIVGTRQTVDVKLLPKSQGLDEVVIVGYGTSKVKDLTGSVSKMGAAKIRETGATNFAEALQGRVAGVRVNSQSGEPGASMNIQIRGANSINASSAPLYIIDGLQIDSNDKEVASSDVGTSSANPLATLNTNDIESMEVLKDASATAIYGARGANGVIIITTKSGKGGKSTVTLDSRVGFSNVAKRLHMLSPQDYINYRYAWDPNNPSNPFGVDTNGDGKPDTPLNASTVEGYNWQDLILRTGFTQNHNVAITNSTPKTNYTLNLGYLDQEGIITSNDYKRYSGQIKVHHNFSDRFTIDGNLNYGRTSTDGAVNSGGSSASFTSFTQSIYTYSPVNVNVPGEGLGEGSTYIPLTSMFYDAYKNITLDRLIGGVGLSYQIIPKLTLKSNLAVNTSSSELNEFYGKHTIWGSSVGGRASIGNTKTTSLTQSNVLDYKTAFGKSTFNAMLGQEVNTYDFRSSRMGSTGFEDESTGMFDISKGLVYTQPTSEFYSINRLSFFGRINYNYASKYYLTTTLRSDGSSNFGPGNKYAYFPSAAISWRASNEKFFANMKDVINDLKFRVSYGVTGNDRIPAYSSLSKLGPRHYAGNGNVLFGMIPLNPPNPDLKWEQTSQFDGGVDLSLFDSRVTVTADVYKKETKDLLLEAVIPSQTGFPTQMQNIGKLSNRGFELTINTQNVINKEFSWSTNFNFDMNRNKVESLGSAQYIPVNISNGFISQVGRVIVGQPIGTGYGYMFDGNYQLNDFNIKNSSNQPVDPSTVTSANYNNYTYTLKPGLPTVAGVNVMPGDRKYKDLDGNGTVNANDMTVISNSNPRYSFGIGNDFTYKNFTLSVFFEGVYGQQIVNMFTNAVEASGTGTPAPSYNLTQDFWDNRWTPENPSNTYARMGSKTNNFMSSYYTEGATYLRFKNLSLTYKMDNNFTKKLGINNLKLNFTADNLFIITNYSGVDPDIRSSNNLLAGHDLAAYPRSRSYFFGIIADFKN